MQDVTIYIQSKNLNDKQHIINTFSAKAGHFENSTGNRVGGGVGYYFEITAQKLGKTYLHPKGTIPDIYRPREKSYYNKLGWTFVPENEK